MTLKSDLQIHQLYLITAHRGPPDLVERLNELGFRSQTQCQYLGRTPFRGPLLFRVGPMVMALRESEAECLIVEAL